MSLVRAFFLKLAYLSAFEPGHGTGKPREASSGTAERPQD